MRMGQRKDLGVSYLFIYCDFSFFFFLVFGFTGMGGTLPTVPHWSLTPQTLLSLIPTYLSTCISLQGWERE